MFLYVTSACHVSKDNLHHYDTSIWSFFFRSWAIFQESNHWKVHHLKWLPCYNLHSYGFSSDMFDDRKVFFAQFWQFCLHLLVENMRNTSCPQNISRQFPNEKVANAPSLHDMSMVDRFKPRYLGTQRQDKHRRWRMPISQVWVKQLNFSSLNKNHRLRFIQSPTCVVLTYMGVSWNGGTPSHHPFSWNFPWNIPTSFWDPPWLWKSPYVTCNLCRSCSLVCRDIANFADHWNLLAHSETDPHHIVSN